MSVPNIEIYQVEKHIETAIVNVLSGVCPNIYRSRDNRDLESSRVEIKAILGENLDHKKAMYLAEAYDAWTAGIEVTVATNRSTDEGVDNHSMLLGAVRARLTNRYLALHFQHHVIAITEIRDSGTLDSFVDENTIDTSVLSFYILVNIKPDAWLE